MRSSENVTKSKLIKNLDLYIEQNLESLSSIDISLLEQVKEYLVKEKNNSLSLSDAIQLLVLLTEILSINCN